ncbi:PH domain-containing protein [Nocardioides daphniae]|uniref:Membrane protein n=1 Tax=Nocardioides daphniae TaxID=402297 RepID=A0A4P7UEB7_9ACTN|nr:PH domain-containing protein [Nocardioides daphniae]QCC77871.1 PH domain-containing protein [Nocardioides daphniae]GGD27538.1 membrane protein [Nocardioides daphniae]
MAIPEKLLNEGEHVVVHTRSHAKALIGPVLLLVVVVAAVVGVGFVAPTGTAGTVLGILVGVVAAVVVLWWFVRPLIDWLTTTYTFTNRRFIARSGFIAKEGRTIPLNRISGVDFEIGVIDRLFGCGTLIVSDASADGRVEVHDIPRVEEVQLKVADELHRLERGDDGA